ncbi:hypothetical protein HY634_01845 [Candidatus Uhrbacteria bacterium]|nr:hypothetical protein [Candidatus Uhrbacteria bacterium]
MAHTDRRNEIDECAVCGGRTNLVHDSRWSQRGQSSGINRTFWGGGTSTICPNAEACWHHELEARIRWLRFPHPASVREEITREIEAIRNDPANVVRHDVEGVDVATIEGTVRRVRVTFVRPEWPPGRPDPCPHGQDRDGQITVHR